MISYVSMPRQGQSVESCILTKWYKEVGETVMQGDIVFSYETDKSSFDYESKTKGILIEKYFNAGDEVTVLENVCAIGDFDDKFPTASNVNISPRAKKAAERLNIKLDVIKPTGPNNRITGEDVLKYAALNKIESGPEIKSGYEIEKEPDMSYKPKHESKIQSKIESRIESRTAAGTDFGAGAEFEDFILSENRKSIANSMQRSLSMIPQLTLHTSFDATEILDFSRIEKEKNNLSQCESITINDIIIYTVARVLRNHRILNSTYVNDRLRTFLEANIGVAIDTNNGLQVFTLINANKKSLREISSEMKAINDNYRNSESEKIVFGIADTANATTFTITNLGMFGIESFTPVIDPPQTGILGINAITQRLKLSGDNLREYPAIGLSLTFDHRVMDGADAARFLRELCERLENFSLMLAF